jgi:hypothetical protein
MPTYEQLLELSKFCQRVTALSCLISFVRYDEFNQRFIIIVETELGDGVILVKILKNGTLEF